jgi:DNA-directed RNA polymerase subunit RPC12/RpoP
MENELQDRYNPKSIWAYMWFSRKRYVRCPKCGAVVSKEEKICPKCGFKIHEIKINEKLPSYLQILAGKIAFITCIIGLIISLVANLTINLQKFIDPLLGFNWIAFVIFVFGEAFVISTILFFFVFGILIVLGIVGAQWEKYKKKHQKS